LIRFSDVGTKKYHPADSKPSGEIRLDELWTRVDIDLTQDGLPGVNEAVRRVRGNDHDAAGFHFVRLITGRDGGASFNRERDLDIRMRV
jgi:hypothetical protein